MRNLILSLILVVCTLTTCRKARTDVNDYYPSVSTVSATITEDGSVEVKANVTLEHGTLEYMGFCMDTLPVPVMMTNQQIVKELNGTEFKTIYEKDFDPAKIYYFRSWAVSEEGYRYGNVISLTNIEAPMLTPPCTLNENSSNVGLVNTGSGSTNSVYQVTEVKGSFPKWTFTMHGYFTSAGTLNFTFGEEPKTKIYTTTYSSDPYKDDVWISLYSGFSEGTVNPGSKVYVNRLSKGIYEITICDAPWKVYNSNATPKLNARFISPYN